MQLKPPISYFDAIRMDCTNIDSAMHATTCVFCIDTGCTTPRLQGGSLPTPAALQALELPASTGRKSLTGALRLPASSASKASLVTSHRCERRLNGASKGASCQREKTPETVLRTALPRAPLAGAKRRLKRRWYGAWNGAGLAPKMTPAACLEWRLKISALTASKWRLRTAHATPFGTTSEGRLERAWSSLWRAPGLAS